MFGELYLEGVYDNAERGPLAVICGHGIDGNIADVYGETREEASLHALYIIHSVNDRLKREVQIEMVGTMERCPICGARGGEPCYEDDDDGAEYLRYE